MFNFDLKLFLLWHHHLHFYVPWFAVAAWGQLREQLIARVVILLLHLPGRGRERAHRPTGGRGRRVHPDLDRDRGRALFPFLSIGGSASRNNPSPTSRVILLCQHLRLTLLYPNNF